MTKASFDFDPSKKNEDSKFDTIRGLTAFISMLNKHYRGPTISFINCRILELLPYMLVERVFVETMYKNEAYIDKCSSNKHTEVENSNKRA